MPSVQELETQVQILQRKVDLLMKVATVTKRTPSTLMPGEFVQETMTLEDLYKEVQHAGGELKQVSNG